MTVVCFMTEALLAPARETVRHQERINLVFSKKLEVLVANDRGISREARSVVLDTFIIDANAKAMLIDPYLRKYCHTTSCVVSMVKHVHILIR